MLVICFKPAKEIETEFICITDTESPSISTIENEGLRSLLHKVTRFTHHVQECVVVEPTMHICIDRCTFSDA